MCGIVGFWNPHLKSTNQDLAAMIGSMANVLAHRGPDGQGTWVDAEQGLALGHRRLAVIDLSETGAQPMETDDGDWVMVYNGEIYNHPILRKELEHRRVPFRGRSDSEVLIKAVQHWGLPSTLKKIEGMFAFALWNKAEQQLYLARDRMGEKPLYYGVVSGTLFFASELKALRRNPDFCGKLDHDALASFFRYGCVPIPQSIYKGIKKLEAGHWICLNARSFETPPPTQAYWSIMDSARNQKRNSRFAGSKTEAVDLLEQNLTATVQRQLTADVPVGVLLSGGIDSTSVVALAHQLCAQPLQTFTVGFHESDFDEAKIAARIAGHFNTNHHELYVGPGDALDVIPKLPEIYDEPFADSSQIPTYLITEMASQHVKVCLTGDGGDEMFGGYYRHFWIKPIWALLSQIAPSFRRTISGFLINRSNDGSFLERSNLTESLGRFFDQPGEKWRKLVNLMSARCPKEIYERLVSAEGQLNPRLGDQKPVELDWDSSETFGDWAERYMLMDSQHYLANDLLVKVDRAAMAHGLETRLPFLDLQMIECAWSLPIQFKVKPGKGKLILREMLNRHIRLSWIDRAKTGFAVPLAQWLKAPLLDWADSLVHSQQAMNMDILDHTAVTRLWRDFLNDRTKNVAGVWSMLMFLAWMKQNS